MSSHTRPVGIEESDLEEMAVSLFVLRFFILFISLLFSVFRDCRNSHTDNLMILQDKIWNGTDMQSTLNPWARKMLLETAMTRGEGNEVVPRKVKALNFIETRFVGAYPYPLPSSILQARSR